jgi:hypothetical protein
MDIFQKIVGLLTYAAMIISVVEVYFKLNKIWKRKHEKEVAESQSIIGLTMSSVVLIVWGLDSLMKGNYSNIVDNIIYLGEAVICILIGAGFFVIDKKKKQKNIWSMVKSALRLEKTEAGYLWKVLTGKGLAEKIVDILLLIAWIDDEIDKSEKDLIIKYTLPWGIKISDEQFENNPHLNSENKSKIFETIKQYFHDYLKESPPKEHIMQVKKLFKNLISIDGKITKEEGIILDEIEGMIKEYFGEPMPKYTIIIIPQNDDLRVTVESIVKFVNPEINMKERERNIDGGFGFIVDECYSKDYAEILAEEQRSQHNNKTLVKKSMINI